MRRSGLQTDVLTLYRRLLKAALKKDDETAFMKQKKIADAQAAVDAAQAALTAAQK